MTVADPIVFIGGTPRSGTTLLRNMLDAHPDLALPDESYFLMQTFRRLARRGRLNDARRAWLLIRESRSFQWWGLDRAVLADVVAANPPRSFLEVVRALFVAYARMRGKPYTGDKTTDSALHFDVLAQWFPESRFIHVIRDPREVAMSLSLQYWHRGGLVGAATVWRNHVAAARSFARQQPDRCYEVRYERLVAQPAEELEAVARFLGLPYREEMLAYPSSSTLLPDHHHNRAQRPPQAQARPWSTEMDRHQVACVELVAGNLMKMAGYGPTGRRPTVAAWAELLRYKADNRGRNHIARRQLWETQAWTSPPEGTTLTAIEVQEDP